VCAAGWLAHQIFNFGGPQRSPSFLSARSHPAAPSRARTVRKAVVPAAGLGTRFLPATKATPKEILPVADKPAIQYVVEEAAAAGLDDVLMVTGRHVGDQPFAVLLGYDLTDPREDLLSRMLDVRDRHAGSVIALMEVPLEQIHLYGCAAVEPTGRMASSGSPAWSRSRHTRTRPAPAR
jgi:UTP-glucose-1-phosphate uridylyltransferase